ncbi:uncharacterized protein LOC122398744 [Colletes gigas]|uniref:uncharacterized protein LOC122398744 n=1 Tax=Colletes gigas TaxID=935657 RepID=UPI001C9A937A|nr:uncharacterized protein LOC122398744 [Colletes gigas]
MPPCLRRKRISSDTTTSKTKFITKKEQKIKDHPKITGTRSVILSRSVLNEKESDISTETDKNVTQSRDKKITRSRNLKKSSDSKLSAETKRVEIRNNINSLKKVKKNDSRLRQVLLKESFLNQSKTRQLRPRRIVKNYDEDLSKCLSPKLNTKGKTVPIYKYVSPEKSVKDANEIYEFKFDINDSKEKVSKKRKKKPTLKKTLARKKKNIYVKPNVQKTRIHKEEPVNTTCEVIKEKPPIESLQDKVFVKPLTENPLKDPEKDAKNEVASNVEQLVLSPLPDSTNEEKTPTITITKPTIASIQNLDNNKVTIMDNSQLSNSEEFRPFRPTNIFNNKLMVQHKNVLNHSLFEKSLSPIVKSSENLDMNSPWRVPALLTFSQVKNVFQSTPQNKNYEISTNKFSRAIITESKNCGNSTIVKDILQENNENVSVEAHVNTNTIKKKRSSIPRKFGTEITNIDQSLQSHLAEEINEQVLTEIENIQPSIQLTNVNNINNASKFGNTENREKFMLHCQTPKKVLKKTIRKNKNVNPQKTTVITENYEQKENLNPEPGPSGLQKNIVFNEDRILKQSNLNNFLNVMEKPQSTTIRTNHGIFDDVSSTPVNRKPIKKLNESSMELRNAFGFDEDDYNENISFTEHHETNVTQNEKHNEKPFLKISVDKIKNNFLLKKPRNDVRNKENVENKRIEVRQSPIKAKQNQVQKDSVSFSDTFDVFSEINETATVDTSNIPLFVDVEPTHFTQPPRHSYKRKRAVRFSFSDGNSDDEEENLIAHEIKRKKNDNKKKGENKNIIKWIQNINKTFDEIDQHELLIE